MSSTMSRSRSPRFPSHSLNDAIEFSKRIYDGVHRSQVDSLTALRLMGFSGKSGASAAALGTVRQFGLIEGVGEKTRISDLALRILEPESTSERRAALQEAAMQPDVFQRVYERFNSRIPPSNEPLRAFLIRELGFSKNGVEECIKSLRQTIEQSDIDREMAREDRPSETVLEVIRDAKSDIIPDNSYEDSPYEMIRIPLTKECTAEIKLIGIVSERALDNLIRHIDLAKEVWAEG